ncbi:RNA polymerase sigma factor [Amycolatopsis minnesotensis]|uniref:Sigma factor-like helix-turn-helix DNA-binding protein n=1 Tax=Amycolatopsis minnesotensis TaxID=337894 RepID=A0ABP5BXH8_9PSEU
MAVGGAHDFTALLRELTPQVLGVLVQRHGDFASSEDAVQEALLAASVQWPSEGVPSNPRGWLVTVASRRLMDHWRRESTRRKYETTLATLTPADEHVQSEPDTGGAQGDDTLKLLFLCCHPALSPASQVALTLRAIGGLSTAEIARAFMVPEATMTRRISRAKQRIESTAVPFGLPAPSEWDTRLDAVLRVLYLIFNEGYTASHGAELQRRDLATEAIRLTTELHRLLPEDGEVTGLLALVLLVDARHPARTGADGMLVPLADQDRRQWKQESIRDGIALITHALSTAVVGPYQLQAAIAAVHDEATRAEDTDWAQIVALYELLQRIEPGPVVSLNHAIAVAMATGPRAGLALLSELDEDEQGTGYRITAARAHLLELDGALDAAREAYETAAARTTSIPENRYLEMRARRIDSTSSAHPHDKVTPAPPCP